MNSHQRAVAVTKFLCRLTDGRVALPDVRFTPWQADTLRTLPVEKRQNAVAKLVELGDRRFKEAGGKGTASLAQALKALNPIEYKCVTQMVGYGEKPINVRELDSIIEERVLFSLFGVIQPSSPPAR